MICILCKKAKTHPGRTTLMLERGDTRLMVLDVPAIICPLCGEAYMDEETATRLLEMGAEMETAGLEADVRAWGTSII